MLLKNIFIHGTFTKLSVFDTFGVFSIWVDAGYVFLLKTNMEVVPPRVCESVILIDGEKSLG